MRYIFQRQASLDPSFILSFKLKSWVFVNGFKTDTCTLNSGTTSLNTFFIIWLNNWIELNLLRWLDWIFWGWYLPSLSINYVGMSKDMEKRLPQLYYIKMKISYDLGFIVIRVAMATQWRHYVFHLSLCFSVPRVFWINRLREYVPPIIASIMAKFKQILWEHFRNTLKCSFKNHQNSEIAC